MQIAHRDGGKDKINHAFYYGHDYGDGTDAETRVEEGYRYTIDSISWLLSDIPIHHYVSIDMDGVVEIVDLIGGNIL